MTGRPSGAIVTDVWAQRGVSYNAFPHPQQIVPAAALVRQHGRCYPASPQELQRPHVSGLQIQLEILEYIDFPLASSVKKDELLLHESFLRNNNA